MQPTRPIKTFDKWYRHRVTPDIEYEDRHLVINLLNKLGLSSPEDYRITSPFRSLTGPGATFYFDDINHANQVIKEFRSVYELLPPGQGIRRDEGLAGNFTMDDLKNIFGDPLPDKVQYLLADLMHRGIDYFHDFRFMHQDWGRKWWPVAFVLEPDGDYEMMRQIHAWLYQNVKEYNTHACGMVEFSHLQDAVLFKLTFGEAPLPLDWEHLVKRMIQDKGLVL